MKLVDTHCHIHDSEFFDAGSAELAYQKAVESGVDMMLLVATSLESSRAATEFAHSHPEHSWASIGIHPHEALNLKVDMESLRSILSKMADDKKVIAVGECGFDFYYNDRSKALQSQGQLLEVQLQVASDHGLPVSFHVREAFDDFWPVFDNFPNIKGVLHSFTDRQKHVDKALSRGLLFGINGISTFTSHSWQRDLYRGLPIENIILETDSPFLTPVPRRGTINTPENVIYITNFMAELRGEDAGYIAEVTTKNARKLFEFS